MNRGDVQKYSQGFGSAALAASYFYNAFIETTLAKYPRLSDPAHGLNIPEKFKNIVVFVSRQKADQILWARNVFFFCVFLTIFNCLVYLILPKEKPVDIDDDLGL